MSTRIQIIALDLAELRKYFGSKNSAIENDLIESFTELADEIDLSDKEIDSGTKAIKSLIQSGAKSSQAEEGVAEISAVSSLADHLSKSYDGDYTEWTWKEFDELQTQFGKRLDPRTKELLAYFTDGRNLIGKGFDSDSGCYLYLTSSEVRELKVGLEKVYKVASEIVDSGAMNEQDFESSLVDTMQTLVDTLSAITEEKADLFAIAT